MGKTLETDVKVGLFVSLGIGLMMVAILLLGGTNNFLTRNNSYFAHFPSVEGLIPGAKVVLGGLQVGTVESIDFSNEHRNIRVGLKVLRKFEEWVRRDSTVEILTQGVLGDKYIAITPGASDEPVLSAGSELTNRPTKDLAQFISKGDQLMASLNGIAKSLDHLLKTFETGNRSEIFFQGMATSAKNLSQVTQKLNEELGELQLKRISRNLGNILEKINNGTGTLGAMINDPGLYYDAKALMGGANRNRIVRNLVRKTIKDAKQSPDEDESAPAQEAEKK